MTFPTSGILDDFERAAENPLSKGGWWASTSLFGATRLFQTDGHRIYSTQPTNAYVCQAWIVGFPQPLEAYCTIAAHYTGATYLINCLNSPTSSAASGYCIGFTGSAWNIYRRDAGSLSASLTSGSFTVTDGCKIGMSISADGVITAYGDTGSGWTALGTATDTTYVGIGYLAPETNYPGVHIDDFGGGMMVGATGHLVPKTSWQDGDDWNAAQANDLEQRAANTIAGAATTSSVGSGLILASSTRLHGSFTNLPKSPRWQDGDDWDAAAVNSLEQRVATAITAATGSAAFANLPKSPAWVGDDDWNAAAVNSLEQRISTTLGTIPAANYYVATTGSDSTGNGTFGNPFATITHAVAAATGGQTIAVHSGTYVESVIVNKDNLTLKGYGPTKPIIDANHYWSRCIQLGPTYGTGRNITIDGFELRNTINDGGGGIYGTDVRNCTIKNCKIHDCGSDGAYHSYGIILGTLGYAPGCTDNIIQNNEIYNIGPGGEATGIFLNSGTRNLCDGNLIYLVRKEGIRDFCGYRNTFKNHRIFLCWAGFCFESSTGSTFANNVVHHNKWGMISKHLSDPSNNAALLTFGVTAEWSKLWHNTSYKNTHTSYSSSMPPVPISNMGDFRNNLLCQDSDTAIHDYSTQRSTNWIIDGNAYNLYGYTYYDGITLGDGPNPTCSTVTALQAANLGTAPYKPFEANGQTFTPTFTDPVNGDFTLTNTPAAGPNLGDQWGTQVGATGTPPVRTIGYTAHNSGPPGSASGVTVLSAPPSPGYIPAARAANNTDNSYWLSNDGVTSGSFVFDLGSVKPLNIVVMQPTSHQNPQTPRGGITIDTSNTNNGADWVNVYSTTHPDNNEGSFKYVLPNGTSCRYVRYSFTSNFGGAATAVSDFHFGYLQN